MRLAASLLKLSDNGRRYEIEADCERLTINHHRSLNGKQSPQIALKPLCFIPRVMVSCFVNQIVKLININKMEYFGTNLTEHGHYSWDLTGDRMVKIGLLPKHTPFNPEELTINLPKGEVIYYQSSKFTVLGISGSCKDERNGTKSIFWVK